jgi:hypothetical protein
MTGAAPPDYAGPVSRGLAYGLDTFLVAVAFTGGVVVTGLIASVIGTRAHDLVRAAGAAYLLVLPILFAFYCAVFWALAGRTPGMALVGVRVVAPAARHGFRRWSGESFWPTFRWAPPGHWLTADTRACMTRWPGPPWYASSLRCRRTGSTASRPLRSGTVRWHPPSRTDEVNAGPQHPSLHIGLLSSGIISAVSGPNGDYPNRVMCYPDNATTLCVKRVARGHAGRGSHAC